MKKLILPLMIVTVIAVMLVTGCDVIFTDSKDTISGSENLETRQYDFTDFNKIDIGSAFRYEIEKSDTFSIEITADDNLYEHIRVRQDGQTLKIDLEPFLHFGTITVEAFITMPELHGLESSGATRGVIRGFDSDNNLDINVSGASRVEFDGITTGDIEGEVSGASRLTGRLDTGDIDLNVSGASVFRIDGTVRDMTLAVSGASNIEGSIAARNIELDTSGASEVDWDGSCDDLIIESGGAVRIELGDLTSVNADIRLSGASTCRIHVSGTLDVNLSGGSKLYYTGDAIITSTDISGGSQLKKENG